VGLVVGRKVGGAVQRNRAKRRLREAVRTLPLQDDTDYVIVASAAVVGVPFDRLTRWLADAIASEEIEA
jgi:ribonuclease P protein component